MRAEGSGLAAGDLRRPRPRACARTPSRSSACGFPAQGRRHVEGHRDRLRASTSTSYTHIEATRYSRGSDDARPDRTMLTGDGRASRVRLAAGWLGKLLPPPDQVRVRACCPFGFARQTLILLVMQTIDGHAALRCAAALVLAVRAVAQPTEGQRIPTNIPEANAFAERAPRRRSAASRSLDHRRSCSTCR